MDAERARIFLEKFQSVIEDLWIEKQACRDFILARGLMSESVLDQELEKAKHSAEHRKLAAENFAGARQALAEFGLEDWIRKLSEEPRAKDKEN
jgi:hypothetical protein